MRKMLIMFIILIFVFTFSFHARAPGAEIRDVNNEFARQINELVKDTARSIELPLESDFEVECKIVDSAQAKKILGKLYNSKMVGFCRYGKIYLIEKDIKINIENYEGTIRHEGVHIIQNLLFNGDDRNYIKRYCLVDRRMAIRALEEGHATHAELLTSSGSFSVLIIGSPISFFNGDGSLKDLRRVFVYDYGWRFAEYLYRKGGWKLLNSAFNRLPQSSEQIMHPEKYLAGEKFDDVDIFIPNGYKIDKEGMYGEFGILSIMLKDGVCNNIISKEKALSVAEGWNGDKFVIMENNEGRILKFVTHWDTEKDAKEFFDAYILIVTKNWGVDPESEFDRDHSKTWIHSRGMIRTIEIVGKKVTIQQY